MAGYILLNYSRRWICHRSDILMCLYQRHSVSVLFNIFRSYSTCFEFLVPSLLLISNGFQDDRLYCRHSSVQLLRQGFSFIYYWNSILHCTLVDSLSSHLETIPFTFVCDFIFGFTTNDSSPLGSWSVTCAETLAFDKVWRVSLRYQTRAWPTAISLFRFRALEKADCCSGWKKISSVYAAS